MLVYNKYLIKEGEVFNEEDYPKVNDELVMLREEVKHLPANNRADIIISYLKFHSIKNEFIDANPKLVESMTTQPHNTGHIEALFQSCKQHQVFLHDFEEYLKKNLLSSSITF